MQTTPNFFTCDITKNCAFVSLAKIGLESLETEALQQWPCLPSKYTATWKQQ